MDYSCETKILLPASGLPEIVGTGMTSGEKRNRIYKTNWVLLFILVACVWRKILLDSDTSMEEAQATAINLPTAAKVTKWQD